MRTELSTREQARRAAADTSGRRDGDRRDGASHRPAAGGRAAQAGRAAGSGQPARPERTASGIRSPRVDPAAGARSQRPARAGQPPRSDRDQRAVAALRAEQAGPSGPATASATATVPRTRPAVPPRRRTRPPGRVSPPPRPASPRPAPAPAARKTASPAGHSAARRLGVPRTPFALLVLGLLGGGLVCLLVINTTLGSASYKINDLQQGNALMSQQVQALQNQVATEEAPAVIARKAHKLGMRPEQFLAYLNARTGRITVQPTLRNIPRIPGFTP